MRGIGPGDVVASLLPNGAGTIAAALAAMAVGRLAPINLFLNESEIRALRDASGASIVMVPADVPAAVSGVFESLRRHLDDRGRATLVIDTAAVPEGLQQASGMASRASSDHVALFHTGGTTGLPKFVPLTARNIAATALISGFAYGYEPHERVRAACRYGCAADGRGWRSPMALENSGALSWLRS